MKAFLILCITLAVILACDAVCTSGNKGSNDSGSNDSGSNGNGSNGNGSNGNGSNGNGSNDSGSNGNGSDGNNSDGKDTLSLGGGAVAGKGIKSESVSETLPDGTSFQKSEVSAKEGAGATGSLTQSSS